MRTSSLLSRLFGMNSAAAVGALQRPDGARWGRICPHCKGPSWIRSSMQVTPSYSEQLRMCQNPLCGHIWVDGIEAVRTLSPSAVPDVDIRIPLSRHIRREQVVALMNQEEQMDIFGDRP